MQNIFKSLTGSLSYLMVFRVIARYQPVNNSKITKFKNKFSNFLKILFSSASYLMTLDEIEKQLEWLLMR